MMDVQSELQEIFRDVFDDQSIKISDETTASDIEEWDSLMHVQLILSIEQHFRIKFKTSEIGGLANVGDFKTMLQSKLALRG